MTKFVHLHTHSHYSLLDGLSQIPDLVARVKELGMDMLAVTDHGVLYGAVEFYKTARKAGIKPILGMETYVAPKSRLARDSNERYYHLILLAENDVGWHNLIQLSTKAHLEGFYYKPRVDKELLREHHAGLIATSACLGGELSQLLLQGEYDTAKRVALEYRDIFGAGNYFLEHGEHPHIPDAVKVKPLLIQLARETGIPLVAAQDSHYLRPEDGEYHDVLLAVQTSNRLADDDRLSMKADNFAILSPDEMAAKYADLPEAIENTVRIGERCNVTLELDKVILPDFPKPEGETADQYLRELVETRLPGRFPERAVAPEVRERLEFELGVIQKTGYADYFLIVQDLINWAKTHGIAVGPGRGSAAGSLVSYVLGITGVNPLTYDLLFERFLNPDRIQMPDIDMDFADKRRDEVIAYVRQKYGSDRVAQIITFGTMAARAAIRDAGRAMGLPYNLCDQVAKLIPFNMNLAEAIKKVPELAEFYQNPETKKLLDTARHLEGVARHASVHACGIVISKEPLVNIVPLQLAPQDKDSIVTQLEMHSIEDLGLLKMDFLGLRNLTTIEETVRLVRELHGETIDIANIPLNDPATFTLLQRADTSGVFQFECLSGDTMISNTTLKKLYERRNRKTLESVYVDEGKVHRNTILGIAKSGKKDVYTLIADNNWFIKATAEHSFLTENGWKKLKNIRPGEKVLLRTKARHLVYNTCLTCRKQIDGQKNGKSRFCYACSAAHFKNPSKDISRTKMREARRNFFRNGGRTWNLGVTTENNEVWRETARKISQALTGVSIEDRWGAERATEIKRRFSERFRGAGNPMFGRRSPHRKGGIRPDLGHYVRSNWEADFARILNYFKTGYQYEPKTFRLTRGDGSAVSYTPDFYVPTTNTFYEIKGWLHELDQEKMDLFQTQYPEYNFVLVNKTKFAELALQYRDLVAWECPKIPEKNFEFVKVREVKYSGIEETYDIAMQAPGNNFVANGFVVHNSSGMRRYMKDIHPTELEDLVALVALFRPGPMELIPSYIKRKNGEEKIAYLHPKLEPILKNTYGIGVYQEQMMRIARDLAGYTLSEADTLRKAIGKKIKSLLDEQEEKLVAGMTKNGIAPKAAKAIWELFPPFARYGFNRCVTGDTQINDPVTGQLVAVEELFRDKTRLAQTYSIDQGGKVFTNGITDILDNGPKDVYSVKTKSGRKIKATANHPLLTPQGWRKLEDIEAGTRIAVPRILPEPAQPLAAQHHRAALLGYLLAEGNLCHPHGFYFYSASEAEITDYIQNLEKFDNTVAVIDRSKPAASVYAKRKDVKRISAAVAWVESLGMKNKTATQKTIPDWACRLANEDLAVLIAKMFQGDGCLHLRGVNPQIYYATSSHRLAQGLQHLLLRFGILSTIHQKGFKYRGTIKPGYTVSIGRHDNIGKFIANFMQHFVGQKQAVAREILRGHPILNQLPRSKLTRYELKTTQVVSFRPPHQVRGELGAACPPPAENPGGNTEWIPDIFHSSEKFRDDPRTQQADGVWTLKENQSTYHQVALRHGLAERLFFNDTRKAGFLRETVSYLSEVLANRPLREISESDIFWDKVAAIEPAGTEMTYDLSMQTDHNFIANDIFVHNSHAVCYALIGYQTAYLKAHYPVEFMTSLLNGELSDIERIAFLVQEARQAEIPIWPPDLNASFTAFTPEGKGVRFGLSGIKNVGSEVTRAIVEERSRGGPFRDLSDFLMRVQHKDVNKKSLESLGKAGVFDSLGLERNQILENIDDTIRFGAAARGGGSNGQHSLFGASAPPPALRLKPAAPATNTQKLAWEKELLGFYLSDHPLRAVEDRAKTAGAKPIAEACSAKFENQTLRIAGVVSQVRKIITKSGQPMVFASVEDYSPKPIEVVVFNSVYAETAAVWQVNKVVLVQGRMTNRNDEMKLVCEKAKVLEA